MQGCLKVSVSINKKAILPFLTGTLALPQGRECPGAGCPASDRPGLPAEGRPLAAVYARVSSEKQEQEQTIASQLEALYQAAEARGYALTAELVFVDDGYSGARLDRPGLE